MSECIISNQKTSMFTHTQNVHPHTPKIYTAENFVFASSNSTWTIRRIYLAQIEKQKHQLLRAHEQSVDAMWCCRLLLLLLLKKMPFFISCSMMYYCTIKHNSSLQSIKSPFFCIYISKERTLYHSIYTHMPSTVYGTFSLSMRIHAQHNRRHGGNTHICIHTSYCSTTLCGNTTHNTDGEHTKYENVHTCYTYVLTYSKHIQ